MRTYPEFVKIDGDQSTITHKCHRCNSSKSVTVSKGRLDHYLNGGDTMRDFPELSASEREIILIADRKINAHKRPSFLPPIYICDDCGFWEDDDE